MVVDKKEPERNTVRESAIKSFAEILHQEIKSAGNKNFMQYTKDLIKTYVASPDKNQRTLREVSRFLCRNSMIYKKLIMYYASMPLYYYNITPNLDFYDDIDVEEITKGYEDVLKKFSKFNLRKEGYTALFLAVRDGMYVGYTYTDDKGVFCMPLDVSYCKIYGKDSSGEWITYFDAAYFDIRTNTPFVSGEPGSWDKVFVDGYRAYKEKGKDYRWFKLPPEKTLTLLTCPDDEFSYPLPFFLPLFVSLLDLIDLEQILQSKNELENYKLIVSKIPFMKSSERVDDFAISIELAQKFNELLEAAVPEQIGAVFSPMDIDTVSFENSNNAKDVDALANSIKNLFSNAGISELVVASGGSTSTVAIEFAILNDISTCWVWIDRLQSWLNFYIRENIRDGYFLDIHKVAWYNQKEYLDNFSTYIQYGADIMGWLTAKGDTPYVAYNKLKFEKALGLSEMFNPLMTSYTLSGKQTTEELSV